MNGHYFSKENSTKNSRTQNFYKNNNLKKKKNKNKNKNKTKQTNKQNKTGEKRNK